MISERKNSREWLMKCLSAAGTALLFCVVLFLAVPAMLTPKSQDTLHAIDPLGWDPRDVMEIFREDSLSATSGAAGVSIYVRYDVSAPQSLPLVMNTVHRDGSESQDTLSVWLKDDYGRSTGKHGYMMSEVVAHIATGNKAGDTRLLEMYPAVTVSGVHSVGITPDQRN